MPGYLRLDRFAACLLGATFAAAVALPGPAAEERSWPIVRTADPRGGPGLISAIRVADTSRSEADFAALTLRCHEGRLDVVLALIVPVPPRGRPEIEWRLDDGPPVRARASVLQPSTTLGFAPEDASGFLAAARGARRAAFRISNAGKAVTAGAVSLEGLTATVGALTAQCLVAPN